ncbi:hypothetical protein ZIOFF_038939 [Zingiber officinale]|uniref:Protein kinase domain-containing protein n=1 Tax=Zingiber officinale TaxID=94328 RepID=A0A8J5GAE5_ZINOF|nr:hypothetical protein ZIOFF_038939 [Zingiber officinale]
MKPMGVLSHHHSVRAACSSDAAKDHQAAEQDSSLLLDAEQDRSLGFFQEQSSCNLLVACCDDEEANRLGFLNAEQRESGAGDLGGVDLDFADLCVVALPGAGIDELFSLSQPSPERSEVQNRRQRSFPPPFAQVAHSSPPPCFCHLAASSEHRNSENQIVAIKQLKQDGYQGSNEFLVEVLMLTVLRHPNLVNLIGYCAEGDERLLVYEYMCKGTLEDNLFDQTPGKAPIDWNTRMKIALGAAKGLTYLHDVANPPVIYRDMKAANVLLDENFNPKLSDFGLAKLGPVGDKTHVSTRVMGTHGYCAPDYAMTGKLTVKSDIYSFGVLLLEMITGRRAFDCSKTRAEQNLIAWSRPFLNDRRKFGRLADPSLEGCYPPRAFHQLVVITSMCLQEQAHVRPIIADVVVALDHVASQPYVGEPDSNKVMKFSAQSSPIGKMATSASKGCKLRKGIDIP